MEDNRGKKNIYQPITMYAFNTIPTERMNAVEPKASELANQTGSGLDHKKKISHT